MPIYRTLLLLKFIFFSRLQRLNGTVRTTLRARDRCGNTSASHELAIGDEGQTQEKADDLRTAEAEADTEAEECRYEDLGVMRPCTQPTRMDLRNSNSTSLRHC
ncbi:hypothetical protein BDZ97DRAFT_1381329 [Flammula alnicola]|nr:hypothetical protein BDZ97DRAFT_1381329 [Flammula alnicola]